MKFTTFTALRHRNFRLFFFGQGLSLIGTWMHSLAQGWLVLDLTNSAFYLSLVQAMGSLPILFFSLIGGVIADRSDKKKLLLFTQATSMVLVLALAVVVTLGIVRPWHVIVFAGLSGVVNTFDVPGRQSFIIDLVGKEDLMNGIALNSAAFNGARIIGPSIAGLIIGYIGLQACFYVNSFSFLAIIIALLMMKFDAPAPRKEQRPLLKELREGLSYVKHAPAVSSFIFMVGVTSLLAIPYIALMPIFARDVLHIGVKGLGIMMGSAGLGALAGALTLASMGSIRKKGLVAFVSAFASASALLAFSFSRNTPISLVLLAVVGWGMITQLATVNTMLQNDVPDDLRGRVMSLYTLVFLGFIPIGNLIVGTLAHYLGTPHAVAFSASLCIIIYALMIARKRELLHH